MIDFVIALAISDRKNREPRAQESIFRVKHFKNANSTSLRP